MSTDSTGIKTFKVKGKEYTYDPSKKVDLNNMDEDLRNRYIDEDHAGTMTLEEFAIQERGYGYPASAKHPSATSPFKGDELDDTFRQMKDDPLNQLPPKQSADDVIEELTSMRDDFESEIRAISEPIENYMKTTTEFLEGETWTQKFWRNKQEDYNIADHFYKNGLYNRQQYLQRLDEIANEYNPERFK